MEISAVLTANRAAIDANGLLHVEGGGWEYVIATVLPFTVVGHIAGVVEFSADEFGARPALRLRIENASQDVGSIGSTTVNAHRHRAAFAIPFAFVAAGEDVYTATLTDDADRTLATLSFPIRYEPPTPTPPAAG